MEYKQGLVNTRREQGIQEGSGTSKCKEGLENTRRDWGIQEEIWEYKKRFGNARRDLGIQEEIWEYKMGLIENTQRDFQLQKFLEPSKK